MVASSSVILAARAAIKPRSGVTSTFNSISDDFWDGDWIKYGKIILIEKYE